MSCVLFSHIVSSLFYAFLQDAGTTAAINHAIPRHPELFQTTPAVMQLRISRRFIPSPGLIPRTEKWFGAPADARLPGGLN